MRRPAAPNPLESRLILTPTDIENWGYCPASYLHGRNQEAEEKRVMGLHHHAQQSRKVWRHLQLSASNERRQWAWMIAFLVGIFFYMVTETPWFDHGPVYWILLMLSFAGAIVAAGFMVSHLRHDRDLTRMREDIGLKNGRVPYIDMTLASEPHGLVGRPDHVERKPDGTMVPVEFKSGPAPEWLEYWPGHKLKVGAYCLILEDSLGTAPEYGTVVYQDDDPRSPPRRVIFDDKLRQETIEAINSIRELDPARPFASRQPPSPRQCNGCYRKAYCVDRQYDVPPRR